MQPICDPLRPVCAVCVQAVYRSMIISGDIISVGVEGG